MSTVNYEDCSVEHETEEALLINIPEISDEPEWIPKSTLDKSASEVQKLGDEGTLVIKEWFVIKKEWV